MKRVGILRRGEDEYAATMSFPGTAARPSYPPLTLVAEPLAQQRDGNANRALLCFPEGLVWINAEDLAIRTARYITS